MKVSLSPYLINLVAQRHLLWSTNGDALFLGNVQQLKSVPSNCRSHIYRDLLSDKCGSVGSSDVVLKYTYATNGTIDLV